MDVKARVSSGDELLNEKFTIPSIITTPNPIDFNTFTTPGIYYVGAHNADNKDNNFINNGLIDGWGTLFVSGTGGTLFQLFFADTQAKIFHRFCRNGNRNLWSNWVTMVDEKSLFDENSLLNKVFPVGFSYLTADNNRSHVPSFGKWGIRAVGNISGFVGAASGDNLVTIYLVTRLA